MMVYAPLIGGVRQPPRKIKRAQGLNDLGFCVLTLEDGSKVTAHRTDICKIRKKKLSTVNTSKK